MDPDEYDIFRFSTVWYDEYADVQRHFVLTCHPDKTVELMDAKRRTTFLRRVVCPEVVRDNVYVGAIVNVFNRRMEVTGYADEYTRKKLEVKKQRTFGLIKPEVMDKMGAILEIIEMSGFKFTLLKTATMSQEHARKFYAQHEGKSFFSGLLTYITSGPIVVLVMVADNAISRWLTLIGPTDPEDAREKAPKSLRALFGKNVSQNAVHGSKTSEEVLCQINIFFPLSVEEKLLSPKTTATLGEGVTCCVIKPHALAEPGGIVGRVINAIQAKGFRVNAVQLFKLTRPYAEEFLTVYKGVLSEYDDMVVEMISGACVVMEVTGFGVETTKKFQAFAGPWDPEIGKVLRPNTLRSQFGTTRLRNAIHCTDLPEDALLECEFFFCLLNRV